MTHQQMHDNNGLLELSTDKPRKPYQLPKLIPLETSEIRGGDLNLQEADGTGFVS